MSLEGAQEVEHGGVTVIGAAVAGLPAVQGVDRVDLRVREGEVEDVDVLTQPVLMDGLDDDTHTGLDEPAQDDLGDGFAVLPRDGDQNRILQNGTALAQRRPGLQYGAVPGGDLAGVATLVVGVEAQLIDGGDHPVVAHEVVVTVGVEVGDPR